MTLHFVCLLYLWNCDGKNSMGFVCKYLLIAITAKCFVYIPSLSQQMICLDNLKFPLLGHYYHGFYTLLVDLFLLPSPAYCNLILVFSVAYFLLYIEFFIRISRPLGFVSFVTLDVTDTLIKLFYSSSSIFIA